MLRRLSIILIVAVLLPSTVLAYLAIRSLKDQQIVLERQQGLLYQEVVDGVALQIDAYMLSLQSQFAQEVDDMLVGKAGGLPPERFNQALRERWPLAKVGFVVDGQGALLSPRPARNRVERQFLEDNRSFFANTQELAIYNQIHLPADVAAKFGAGADEKVPKHAPSSKLTFYAKFSRQVKKQSVDALPQGKAPETAAAPKGSFQIQASSEFRMVPSGRLSKAMSFAEADASIPAGRQSNAEQMKAEKTDAVKAEAELAEMAVSPSASPLASVASKTRVPRISSLRAQEAKSEKEKRQGAETSSQLGEGEDGFAGRGSKQAVRRVSPTQRFDDEPVLVSKAQPEYVAFQNLVGEQRQGAYARFLQDKLSVFFWYRPPGDGGKIFGVELSMASLRRGVAALLEESEAKTNFEVPVALAILDEKAQPMAVVPGDFLADWRHPFVAAELGGRIEILPHWEVAAYLVNPDQLQQAATNQRWLLGSVIGLMLLAVALGGVVLWRDLRREVTAARQKTDFVSNVSHELKTPLTSIRMFSELLRRQGPKASSSTPGDQQRYLDIIIAEASRLTRLINNILDFSRMEQSRKQYRLEEMDLAELTQEIVTSYRAHLEENDYTLELVGTGTPLPVRADRDALTQVILNLVSNAEKYGGAAKEICVELDQSPSPKQALVRVLDRGPGVPRGHEAQIFKKFYRAHDSLSSGIQGSGLGLTLAHSIALAHGGTLRYRKRDGGGACFTLALPLLTPDTETTT